MKTTIQPTQIGNRIFLYVAFCLCLCIGQSYAQSNSTQTKLLKRTLIFTFKPQAKADSIQAIDNACIELSKISVIKSFEWGIENTKDKKKRHVYVFGYAKEEDVLIYEKSQQHDNLIKVATATHALESVQGIDYWKEN